MTPQESMCVPPLIDAQMDAQLRAIAERLKEEGEVHVHSSMDLNDFEIVEIRLRLAELVTGVSVGVGYSDQESEDPDKPVVFMFDLSDTV